MARLSFLASVLAGVVSLSQAQRLFVADSGGNVTTIKLTPSATNSTLEIVSRSAQCGPSAADLQLDSQNRILYCVDRGTSSSVNGSLNSFTIAETGTLTRVDREPIPSGGVSSVIFGNCGNKAIVTAS